MNSRLNYSQMAVKILSCFWVGNNNLTYNEGNVSRGTISGGNDVAPVYSPFMPLVTFLAVHFTTVMQGSIWDTDGTIVTKFWATEEEEKNLPFLRSGNNRMRSRAEKKKILFFGSVNDVANNDILMTFLATLVRANDALTVSRSTNIEAARNIFLSFRTINENNDFDV